MLKNLSLFLFAASLTINLEKQSIQFYISLDFNNLFKIIILKDSIHSRYNNDLI